MRFAKRFELGGGVSTACCFDRVGVERSTTNS
jgi:hypothetical protein